MSSNSSSESDVKKGSTLTFLHPSFMDELRFGVFKDSLNIHGSYRMNLRQPNRQPEHAREYKHGDPIRLIDWKAFAKHDQLILREIQDEASASVCIAVEISESMAWPKEDLGLKTNVIQKIQCALRAGMAISYAHLKVGDQVRLIFTYLGKPVYLFKPRSSTDVVASFDRIAKARFSMESMFLECQKIIHWPENIDRIYIISDLLYLDSESHLKLNIPKAKSIRIYHLLSSLELNTDWIDNDSFYHDEGFVSKEYQGRTLIRALPTTMNLENGSISSKKPPKV